MKYAEKRFRIKEDSVSDLYAKEYPVKLLKEEEQYMELQYAPGFLQPIAYYKDQIIAEDIPLSPLEEFYDEDTLLKKVLPVLVGLKQMQEKGLLYGDLSIDKLKDSDRGFILSSLGCGEYNETPNNYSAYEYFAYQGKGSKASDVYSISVIMYQLLSGICLPNAEKRLDSEDEIEPLTAFGVSEKTETVILKGLRIFQDDRYADVSALLSALYDEKTIEGYENDWKIFVRPFKTREADIAEQLEKEFHVVPKEEEKIIEEAVVKEEPKKTVSYAMMAIPLVLILVVVIAYALKPKPQKVEKKIVQIETSALPVDSIGADYTEATPAPLPSMEGMLFAEAKKQAESAGYTVTNPTKAPSEKKNDIVLSQEVKELTVTFTISVQSSPKPTASVTDKPTKAPTVKPTVKPIPTVAPTKAPKATKKPVVKVTRKPVTHTSTKKKTTKKKKKTGSKWKLAPGDGLSLK